MDSLKDVDSTETQEWIDSIRAVVQYRGPERAQFLLGKVAGEASRRGAPFFAANTPYVNTIAPEQEEKSPGDRAIEHRIRSAIRWNAVAIILRANKESSELGGHIASFQSSAMLYDIGFGHFWHAPTDKHGGDLIFVQGHVSPGIYARAFVEGRLTEQQLLNYRQESGGQGHSVVPASVADARLLAVPDGVDGPRAADGDLPGALPQVPRRAAASPRPTTARSGRSWATARCDEPESLGAISLAGRESLDNLIFVINCNLQRLDGPVRGNGKIIQELEGVFRGAGWNVIKVLWGSGWDKLLAKDKSGLLLQAHGRVRRRRVPGLQEQERRLRARALLRQVRRAEGAGRRHERRRDLEAQPRRPRSGQGVRGLRGGRSSTRASRRVILRQDRQGLRHGRIGRRPDDRAPGEEDDAGRAASSSATASRSRCPTTSSPRCRSSSLPTDSPEMKYLHERRAALGGYLPQRRRKSASLDDPAARDLRAPAARAPASARSRTTMAFVQMLGTLVRDKAIGKHIVPIVPDESRTFGMEGMFRQLGIYSSRRPALQAAGRRPADVLPRGQGRARCCRKASTKAARCRSWIAAATSYSTNNVPMIPFYIYYSMFGLQRVGDLAWLAGDMRARGFLLGGTAGRTTLNGEGLQHEDGHSHILAAHHPELRLLRPDLRLRGGGRSSATACAACTRSRRTSTTTSP